MTAKEPRVNPTTQEQEELNTSTTKEMEGPEINETPKLDEPDAQKQREETQTQEPEMQTDTHGETGCGTRPKRDKK